MNNLDELIDKLIDADSNIRVELSPKTLKEFGIGLAHEVVQKAIEQINSIAKQEKEGYITGEKVCQLFNISRGTLWKWDQKGITKPVRIGNIKRYRMSDLKKISDQRAGDDGPFFDDPLPL